MSEFSREDIQQILALGKTLREVQSEILALRTGVASIRLSRPCTIKDGILVLSEAERARYRRIFEREQVRGRASKFVAASGAATRMFQFLNPLVGRRGKTLGQMRAEAAQGSERARQSVEFFENLKEFAFFEQLREALASRGLDCETLLSEGDSRTVLKFLLGSAGLNYAGLPKCLIAFHRSPDGPRSALEEHVRESIGYLKDGQDRVRVHFTVSPAHIQVVSDHLQYLKNRLERHGLSAEVSCSVQERSTDGVALDSRDQLCRDTNGRLLFRPAGHGSLLQNLDALGGDIVFIRTIDNVLAERFHEPVSNYKKVLGGYLVFLQERIFSYLKTLDSGRVTEGRLRTVERFARTFLGLPAAAVSKGRSLEERCQYWSGRLNRPLRVCGVVRHSGEPGGAPFWALERDGSETLQIVEPSQVDAGSEEQRRIWESSQYFNPVDIVCGLRDFRGDSFCLHRFCDPETRFTVVKTWKGRPLRICELPGLWNGGMAHWNTVFLEVPGSTLQPVKTVLDLLAESHRAPV